MGFWEVVFGIVLVSLVMSAVIAFINNKGAIKLKEMEAVNKRIESISTQSFESLVEELRTDNADLKAELSEIKQTLSSIDKMMKDIE